MVGVFDYVVWLSGPVVEIYVVVWALYRKEFLRYFTLNFYLLSLALSDVCRYLVLRTYGFESHQYHAFYYYTDGLVTVIMYFAIMGLYVHTFRESHLSRQIRVLTFIMISATAAFSLAVVQHNAQKLIGPFVVELARNLYFIGVVMTYVLLGVLLKLPVARLRVILLVSAFGLFFGLHAVTYELRALYPALAIWRVIPPLVGAWLPVSLAYTFTRVSEEARFATARVGVGN